MSEKQVNAKDLIGMSIEKAKDLFGNLGWVIRCIKKDGRQIFVTQNIMPNRINVEVEKGNITKVVGRG